MEPTQEPGVVASALSARVDRLAERARQVDAERAARGSHLAPPLDFTEPASRSDTESF